MTVSATSVRRRFLVLTGLRWLPTGMIIPISVLLLQDRGLSLTQIGLVVAVQAVVVLLLELPTGALADTHGRRRTLLIGAGFATTALLFLIFGRSLGAFALYYGFMGVYRALESGPLDAWYVDAALAADPAADIESGLASSAAVLSVAVAGGALAAGGLVAVAPADVALVVPAVAALAFELVHLAAVALLMGEQPRPSGATPRQRLHREVGSVIRGAVRLVRGSRALLALVCVELFWGFGMVTFETLFPPRLAEVIGSTTTAAATLGPAVSAAWVVSAAGAALVPFAVRRFGPVRCAISGRVLQGASVAAMGIIAGPAGLLTAYLATYLIHGATNPLHKALLHRRIDAGNRTTVASLNSMMGQVAGGLGVLALGALAETTSLAVTMLVGAAVLAAAAPLYLPARTPATTTPAPAV